MAKPSFKAFLSHRYKSPIVNLYFFRILSQVAEIQFEVDGGSLATNVTRLERMIRDAEAFIGIYPISDEFGYNPNQQQLAKSSRYFKLEIDIALRFGKPIILFVDRRFGNFINPPQSAIVQRYDMQEITSEGESPSKDQFALAFQDFTERVVQLQTYQNIVRKSASPPNKVVFMLPNHPEFKTAYNKTNINACSDTISESFAMEVEVLPPPHIITDKLFVLVASSDFLVVDLGDNSGIVSFLHGRGIPMIRLEAAKLTKGSNSREMLFGDHEVGYNKDIVSWKTLRELKAELKIRLSTISAPTMRISTVAEADNYFKSASLRNEAVFVSYSGEDEEMAQEIIQHLDSRFNKVFNYRDKGKSISAGKAWTEEIFESLAASSIGIVLLSKTYVDSGNCIHEAQEMVARRDNKQLQILPVKLYKDKQLDVPSYLSNIHYIRYWDHGATPDIVLQEAERLLDEVANKGSK